MTSKFFKLCGVSAIALSSGACVNLDYPISTVDGASAKANFAAQVVDPKPAEGAPEMDAAMADAAVARYRAGEVKQASEEAEAQAIQLNFSPDSGN